MLQNNDFLPWLQSRACAIWAWFKAHCSANYFLHCPISVVRMTLVLSALLAFGGDRTLADSSYSKRFDLPPLRISYSELQDLLDKAASILNVANSTARELREELELRNAELTITLRSHSLEPSGAKIPSIIDSFRYRALTLDAAPINQLEIQLSDNWRYLSVSGRSPEHVDALFSVLREGLLKASSPLGGSGHRFLRWVAIFGLALGLFVFAIFWLETHRRMLMVSILICVLLIFVLLVLPIGELLAGFVGARGDASYNVRYGPELTVWGTVFGAAALALAIFSPFFGDTQRTRKKAALPDSTAKRSRRKQR